MSISVSIIVLTYNSELYIRRALNSIKEQSFQNFEALIIDAGSEDNTKQIVAEFDSRFKWLELSKSDMGMARNYGIAISKGIYITFLDSDDIYLPNKLRFQKEYLDNHPDIEVLYASALHYRTGHPEMVGIKKAENQPTSLYHYFQGLNHNLNTMFMRREVWTKGFRFGEGEKGRYGEEWRLQLSLAVGRIAMHHESIPLVCAELRPDSHTLWSIQWLMKKMAINEIEDNLAFITDNERKQINKLKVLDNLRFKLIIALILEGRKSEASKVLRKITHFKIRLKSFIVIFAASIIPTKTIKKFLIYKWTKKQNSSFVWQKTSDDVYIYLQKLG